MYNNIGAKIKVLAKVIAWVGIICSVITGIGLIIDGNYLTVIGICVILVGTLFFWISSWFMYGFGELIAKAAEIAKNITTGASSGQLTAKMENAEKLKTLITWKEDDLISEEEFEIKKQALLDGE
jgi:Na+-transporting methylmalonyl-CoA/oxaloacetate decarboxylase gamma subunit